MNPNPAPILVALAGGSGSGKTWLADRLQSALGGQAGRLSLDDFYCDQSHVPMPERARINFDHPEAMDWTALETVLRDLLAGRPAQPPCYDFATHCRMPQRRSLEPRPFLLIDGLWLWHRPGLRPLFTLKIFIDCPAPTRLRRRIERDMASRGRTPASVREQFATLVEPMHRQFVAPQKRSADLVLPHDLEPGEVVRIAAQLSRLR